MESSRRCSSLAEMTRGRIPMSGSPSGPPFSILGNTGAAEGGGASGGGGQEEGQDLHRTCGNLGLRKGPLRALSVFGKQSQLMTAVSGRRTLCAEAWKLVHALRLPFRPQLSRTVLVFVVVVIAVVVVTGAAVVAVDVYPVSFSP